jgi:protoheme IX farnesyltransferase
MIGWAAATGSVGLEPLLLFFIVFFWTPPHFWALSLLRTEEYARAGIPMLPVVAGAGETRRRIFLYSLVLVPVGAAPWLFGYAGLLYGVIAIFAGGLMAAFAWRLRAQQGPAGEQAARHLFAYSILYLLILFAVLLVEQGLGGLTGRVLA